MRSTPELTAHKALAKLAQSTPRSTRLQAPSASSGRPASPFRWTKRSH